MQPQPRALGLACGRTSARLPELAEDDALVAVGDALAPASEAFMTDLHAFGPTRELYERNTAAAALRVQGLISEGVAAGEFRDVDAAFAADMAASMMSRIQRREVAATTGLDDASAYRQLASILTVGIAAADE